MTGSYELINYSVRPAKQIERKMICEAAKRLSEFALLESYRYVGFGSIFFSDFSMVHRQLNISNLVSIERDVHKQDRFNFNKPFSCIDMKFGESSMILPSLDWSPRTIMWLDYDGKLNGDVLSDIASFCANASTGSVLIVSVNAQFQNDCEDPIGELTNLVGSSFVPNGLKKSDVVGWPLAKTFRNIITSAIKDAISVRNGPLDQFVRYSWEQTMAFDYSDGAKMTTIGGVLVNAAEQQRFDNCSFSNLAYFRGGSDDAYRIEVPSLTWRELRHLDQQLPLAPGATLIAPGIRSKDLRNYAEVYRYYPHFSETEQ